MSAVVSKKLKFKGDPKKKKKRSHKEVEGEDAVEESGDPNGMSHLNLAARIWS
jgi:hypothetical protein